MRIIAPILFAALLLAGCDDKPSEAPRLKDGPRRGSMVVKAEKSDRVLLYNTYCIEGMVYIYVRGGGVTALLNRTGGATQCGG